MVIDKIIEMVEKHNMISNGDGIIVGLSGGPDSVCLLHALNSLKGKYNIRLYAVHLNHMIRGEEANRDEHYAKEFAESLSLPFFAKSVKVEEYAQEKGLSSEEAGRILRYELFNEILKKTNSNKIALAHNMNDQTETVIMRFLRGTGINGIGGIRPIRDNTYIRPILSCTRQEIEKYCEKNNLKPVIDSTNSTNIYTRNRIRLEVIPYIRKYFNPSIDENLFRVAGILRDEDDFLNLVAERELFSIRNGNKVSRAGFLNLHVALKRRIIRLLIEEAKGDLIGIESKHIEDCISFIDNRGTGKKINLPKDIECEIEYDNFKIAAKKESEEFEYNLTIPGITVANNGYKIIIKIYELNNKNLIDKQFVKYYDYDKIKYGLCFRNRRDGDYMYPKGMTGRKKLKDIFIDKKISKNERNEIPLIACGNEVLWVLGMRDTRNYKISEETERILEVTIERGGKNE